MPLSYRLDAGIPLLANLIAAFSLLHAPGRAHAEDPMTPIYLSDMSRCRPASALSEERQPGKWQLFSYEADGVSGTMIGAPSFIAAPDVTIPVDVSGWHAVYVGYWNPYYTYDGETIVKLRFGDTPVFRRFREGNRCRSQSETAIHEVFMDSADLTGRDLVVGKPGGVMGKKAYIAYIKLVPMTPEQVAAVQRDRADPSTRRLTATIDGMSYLHFSECTTAEQVLELIEPYRHSDVGRVLWAVNYGDRTNYPSKVGTYMAGDHARPAMVPGTGTNTYIVGEKNLYESLRELGKQGIVPQRVAAAYARKSGIRFELMFRLGIIGELPPRHPAAPGRLLVRHPEYRQVLKDGSVVEKASYAFPGVRSFMHDLIREAIGEIDADGVNLCFVRGPRFTRYEKPVVDDFKARFGEDVRTVDERDPRLLQLRADYMTDFVRGVRTVLDEKSRETGRPLALSVWVWPSDRNVWCGRTPAEDGITVKEWISEGLLNDVVCQEGIDRECLEEGARRGCTFTLFTGYRGDKAMSPGSIAKAYSEGVDRFAYWDMDCVQDLPEVWEWLRRAGHREEMENWGKRTPSDRWIKLKTVEGVNVEQGLQPAAYSGG